MVRARAKREEISARESGSAATFMLSAFAKSAIVFSTRRSSSFPMVMLRVRRDLREKLSEFRMRFNDAASAGNAMLRAAKNAATTACPREETRMPGPNKNGGARPAEGEKPVPGGKTVLVEITDGIAWVTLNRPEKRNAISPELSAEMIAILDALEPDQRVGVVVLTGAGNSYCAGMDLKEFFRASDGLTAEERAVFTRASAAWQWRRLSYYMKPTIAMVNGWCFGAGFNSVVACDLAIAANEAEFGLSEINWGMIPAGNVLKATVATMNRRDSLYYTMTGETFNGKKAAAMGFVNESVPLAKLKKRVTDLAKVLLDKNPTTLRQAKHACKRIIDMDWDQSEDYLFAKIDQMRFLDPEQGRQKAMRQFLDEKTYRPGLGNYKREG
jgi:trans-feruloyl-CoA hydratase/vanillin synthase